MKRQIPNLIEISGCMWYNLLNIEVGKGAIVESQSVILCEKILTRCLLLVLLIKVITERDEQRWVQ